jgi:hypothetical protein
MEKSPTLIERFRTTLALFDFGHQMMRQNLRRKFPEASESEIETRLRAWVSDRPGAELGDGVGRPVDWPRQR